MYTQSASILPMHIDPSALMVCKGLGQQAASHIAAISVVQRLSPKKILFCEGDEAKDVYEVVHGTLRLCKLLSDGRRQIIGFLSDGHLLGLAHENLYLYSAEAVTEVTVCRYPRSRFARMVDEVPGFAKRLLAVTSSELSAAQDQMLLLGRKSAAEKVASFLLALAQVHCSKRQEIRIPMARNDIADYLGLTVETVSRTLSKFRQDGVIALPTANSMIVLDRHQLEALASGDLSDDL